MSAEMDKIIEERNGLQDAINNAVQNNGQQSPVFEEIEKWKNDIIKKVEEVAAQARQQAIQLLNMKQTKINTEFKSFSQELAKLKESENFVEHDLIRLNKMIDQFKEDLKQSTQPTTIKLNTEECNGINWNRLIYVEEEQTYKEPQKPSLPLSTQLECNGRVCPRCGKCCDWYPDQDGRDWNRRDDATCTDNGSSYFGSPSPDKFFHFSFSSLCQCK